MEDDLLEAVESYKQFLKLSGTIDHFNLYSILNKEINSEKSKVNEIISNQVSEI